MRSGAGLAWPLITALGITMIAGYGSVFYSFSLLLSPVHDELALPQEALVGAFSIALLGSGLASPWIGMLIDRYGGRGVMTGGSILAGAMLAALSRVDSAGGFYAVWAGLGVSMACILYEPAFGVLTRVHGAQARRAITMVTLMGGFASTVFWPLGQFLIEQQGWRGACMSLALVQWLVCAPLHCWAIGRFDGPRAHGPTSRHAATGSHAASLRQAMSEPTFYWLAGAFVSYQFVFSSTAVHFIPLLQSRGLSAVEAAAVGAMLGPMQVLGRVVELLFGSRLPIAKVGGVAVFLMPIAMAWLYASPPAVLALALFPVLYGGGNGIMTIVRGALPLELYGTARYATISGALAAPTLLATACGPLLSSMLWDPASGYDRVIVALGAMGLGGAACYHMAIRARAALRAGRGEAPR